MPRAFGNGGPCCPCCWLRHSSMCSFPVLIAEVHAQQLQGRDVTGVAVTCSQGP